MADSFVQVPADGAGKKINAYTDANGEYNQTAVLVDQNGNPIIASTGTPGGSDMGLVVRVALMPTTTVTGAVSASQPTAATATLSNVASSAVSVTLKAANASRLGLIITNDSTQYVNVKFGSAASASSYTYRVGPGQVLELPGTPIYTGIVTGIWDAANGNARVTELTV